MAGTLGFPLQLTDPGNYWDLRIVDNDIALDVGRQPLKLADRASIAQDIAHMIRERGYLTAMIAERDARKRRYKPANHVDAFTGKTDGGEPSTTARRTRRR